MTRVILTCVLVCAVVAPAWTQTTQMPAHDKSWWQAIAKAGYAVPADVQLPALLDELTSLLGHRDPELRDDIAYTTLAQWIYVKRAVPEAERLRLMRVWMQGMTSGIGETGTDTVLRRSFSTLALAILPGLDNEAPFLDRAAFTELLTATLSYLRDERDVRGFSNEVGWMHSVAHTADVLRFLGRSRHLTVPEQAQILNGIRDKLAAVQTPLVNGEDERLARAVLSLVARADFDEAAFGAFLKAVDAPFDGRPTSQGLAVGQNRRHLLVSLLAVLTLDTRDLPGVARARVMVVDILR